MLFWLLASNILYDEGLQVLGLALVMKCCANAVRVAPGYYNLSLAGWVMKYNRSCEVA